MQRGRETWEGKRNACRCGEQTSTVGTIIPSRSSRLAYLLPPLNHKSIHQSNHVIIIQIPDDKELASDPNKARRRGSSLVAAMKELASVTRWTQRRTCEKCHARTPLRNEIQSPYFSQIQVWWELATMCIPRTPVSWSPTHDRVLTKTQNRKTGLHKATIISCQPLHLLPWHTYTRCRILPIREAAVI
jgi:hypothetical protein